MKSDIISNLSKLGAQFENTLAGKVGSGTYEAFRKEVGEACLYNPWFAPEFVELSVRSWSFALREEKISRWLSQYPLNSRKPITVAIIMAGNIPMVGLHDLLCVIASGNNALVKLSSDDNRLIPAVINMLTEIDPRLSDRIRQTDGIISGFDAVIATGSNNTSRYFEYYFGKYPHIIRKNRNSAAILTGDETDSDMESLALDIFSYFGLGCRNVSKLFVPEGYPWERLFPHFRDYAWVADHNKYRNNLDYQKSILIINGIHHLDNGFMLLREDMSLISPVSVVNYEYYRQRDQLLERISLQQDELQCIVASGDHAPGTVPFGRAQYTELWDYADGADVMDFLLNIPG